MSGVNANVRARPQLASFEKPTNPNRHPFMRKMGTVFKVTGAVLFTGLLSYAPLTAFAQGTPKVDYSKRRNLIGLHEPGQLSSLMTRLPKSYNQPRLINYLEQAIKKREAERLNLLRSSLLNTAIKAGFDTTAVINTAKEWNINTPLNGESTPLPDSSTEPLLTVPLALLNRLDTESKKYICSWIAPGFNASNTQNYTISLAVPLQIGEVKVIAQITQNKPVRAKNYDICFKYYEESYGPKFRLVNFDFTPLADAYEKQTGGKIEYLKLIAEVGTTTYLNLGECLTVCVMPVQSDGLIRENRLGMLLIYTPYDNCIHYMSNPLFTVQ